MSFLEISCASFALFFSCAAHGDSEVSFFFFFVGSIHGDPEESIPINCAQSFIVLVVRYLCFYSNIENVRSYFTCGRVTFVYEHN